MQVNADIYYIRWNNIQQLLTLPCTYPYTANIGTAETYGPELEITAKASDYVTLSFAGSYVTARITSIDPSLLGTTVGSIEPLGPGIPILNVPKYRATVAVDFSYPITDHSRLTARVDATATGKFYDLDYYEQQLPGNTIADARIGLATKAWTGTLYVRNLTNKISPLTINTHSWNEPTPAVQTASVTTPRTIGLDVSYRY